MQYLETVGSFEGVVVQPELGWFGEAGDNNSAYIRIPVEVTEGEHQGKVAIYRGWLTEKAVSGTIACLTEALNFDGDLAALHEGKATLVGRRCNIKTEREAYQGKDRLKVKWLNPPGGKRAKRMEEAKIQNLVGKISAQAKALAKHKLKQMGKSGAAAPARPEGDDSFLPPE